MSLDSFSPLVCLYYYLHHLALTVSACRTHNMHGEVEKREKNNCKNVTGNERMRDLLLLLRQCNAHYNNFQYENAFGISK